MLHTVLRLAICANPSLVPASPDCLILRIHIPHLLMAAWTLLQAQLISAKLNRHKTTLAPPCPHWNAVMKICAITEDYMMFCLLPRVRLQVGWGSFFEIALVAFRLVAVRSWRSTVSFVINVNRDSRGRSGWLGAGEHISWVAFMSVLMLEVCLAYLWHSSLNQLSGQEIPCHKHPWKLLSQYGTVCRLLRLVSADFQGVADM